MLRHLHAQYKVRKEYIGGKIFDAMRRLAVSFYVTPYLLRYRKLTINFYKGISVDVVLCRY